MKTTYQLLRNATIVNCRKICLELGHDVDLWNQKYNRIIKDVESRTENVAYLSPEEWQRRVYNESVKRLNEL